MCELIAKWFKETRGIEVTGKQVLIHLQVVNCGIYLLGMPKQKSILTGNKNRIQSG